MEEKKTSNDKLMRWAKRIGWIGALFFTLKGLAWLAVFLGLGKLIGL